MKNIIVYYLCILFPLVIMFLVAKQGHYNIFALLIFLYYFYRGITDFYRLYQKGIVDKKTFWKSFIPFWRTQYFKELYFQVK